MENGENTGTTIDLLKDIIAGMAIQTMGATKETSSMTDTILDAMCEIDRIESDITSQVLAEARNAVSALSEQLLKSSVYPFRLENQLTGQKDIEISNSALESLQKLSPLVPEEKLEEFEEIVAQETGKKKLLTPENVIALLALIVSIISMINSFKPQDPQNLSDDSKQFIHDEFTRIVAAIEEKARPDCGCLESPQAQCSLDNIKEGDKVFGEKIDIINDFVEPDRQNENTCAKPRHQDGQE